MLLEVKIRRSYYDLEIGARNDATVLPLHLLNEACPDGASLASNPVLIFIWMRVKVSVLDPSHI